MNTRTRTFVLAITAALLCHCTQEEDMDIDLRVPSPVAVGATVTATVSGASGKAAMDQPSVDDRSIFTIVDPSSSQQKSTFELRALKEGTTTFRARGDNGKKIGSIKEDIEAASPNRIEFSGVANCSSPYLIGAGASFTVSARRYRGTTELHGTGGAFPIDSDLATNADSNEFRAGSSPGLGWIRSKIDTSKLRIEVFEARQATSLKLGAHGNVKIGGEARLTSSLEVSGHAACADAFPRDVIIATTDICEAKGQNGSTVVVAAKKSGKCELTVALSGTTVSAKSSFLVDEPSSTVDAGAPSDAGPLDASITDASTD